MAAQNVMDMPLRRVVSIERDAEGRPREVYECGHGDRARTTGLGYSTAAKRRRCWQCLRCEECGQPIYEHEQTGRNADGIWHADCANAPRS